MPIHWHRRDLRAADNRGLTAASDDGPVYPAFVLDPAVLDHGSPPRVAFMLDALRSLRAWYRDRGSDLLVRRGDPREVLPDLAGAVGAENVTWCKDYSGLARRRDADVRLALDDAGVAREAVHDALLHEPGSITTNQGEHYSVFTYFWKKWRDRPKDDPVNSPAPGDLADADEMPDADPIPTLDDLGFDDPGAAISAASPDAARERLDDFLDADVYRYAEARDYPAEHATSRISAHLKWGTLGIRETYAATESAMEDADGEGDRESVEEFQSQLAWREFYAHVLRYNPEVVTANFKDYENPIEWRTDPDALRAWKDGETGYPIVDAGMRQLREEAWMHNRVRMIVAAFLTKDLLIDWREGYGWFRETLVDHDTANDNGGWQWAASTGTDAQPYFRIFNPTTQGERYDPDAEYVAEYVPELRGVPADAVHSWPDLDPDERDELAPDYPDPIVDHAAARERALATFERARGKDGE